MDIKQDPNEIPNFNSSGRIGEAQPDEPEQEQSSVELDPSADGDGAASGELTTGNVPHPASGRTVAPASDVRRETDPSKTGAGAIDGLVGAP